MTLVKCSECKSEVSDKATECPKCGNPFNSETTDEESVQTIQMTRKKLKKQYLFSCATITFGGLLLLLGVAYLKYTEFGLLIIIVGVGLIMLGSIWQAVVKFIAWWNHG